MEQLVAANALVIFKIFFLKEYILLEKQSLEKDEIIHLLVYFLNGRSV